jgi:hypothetical protein
LAVTSFRQRAGGALHAFVIKPAVTPGDLFQAGNLKALAFFHRLYKGAGFNQAVVSASVQPGKSAPEQETFESGMRKTVQWYLANESWWKQVQDGSYQGERLGLKG